MKKTKAFSPKFLTTLELEEIVELEWWLLCVPSVSPMISAQKDSHSTEILKRFAFDFRVRLGIERKANKETKSTSRCFPRVPELDITDTLMENR